MKVSKAHILVLVALVFIIIKISDYYFNLPQKVELSKLKHILEPGNYKGSGFYEPTSNYPDGLKSKLFMVIKKTNNGLNANVNIKAYNPKSNKLEYSGIRVVDFDYKLNHGDTVFKNSKSFISGSLVSSSHGKITSCSENTLVDSSIGWWHTSKHEHSIKNTLTKHGNKLHISFENKTKIPFLNNHTMTEEYVKI